jgi:hypothetical protein
VPTPRPARPDPHPEPLPCHTASPLMSLQICQSTEPPCGCNANVWTSEAVTPAYHLPACLAGCLSCCLPACPATCESLRISPKISEDALPPLAPRSSHAHGSDGRVAGYAPPPLRCAAG